MNVSSFILLIILGIFTSCHFVENGAGYEGGNPYGSIAIIPDSGNGDGGDHDDGQDPVPTPPSENPGVPPGIGEPPGNFLLWAPIMYDGYSVDSDYYYYKDGICIEAIKSIEIQSYTGDVGHLFVLLDDCNGTPSESDFAVPANQTYTKINNFDEVSEVYINGKIYKN